jgi:hypothetical protein
MPLVLKHLAVYLQYTIHTIVNTIPMLNTGTNTVSVTHYIGHSRQHRLNMGLDLQSLLGLYLHICTH